jgi:hypothetical protein
MRFQLFSAFSFKKAEKAEIMPFSAFFSFVGIFNFFPKK